MFSSLCLAQSLEAVYDSANDTYSNLFMSVTDVDDTGHITFIYL